MKKKEREGGREREEGREKGRKDGRKQGKKEGRRERTSVYLIRTCNQASPRSKCQHSSDAENLSGWHKVPFA